MYKKETDQIEEEGVQTEGKARTGHSQERRRLVGFVVNTVTTRSSVLFGKKGTRRTTVQRKVNLRML